MNKQKSLIISLMGPSNSGKSTLLNTIMETKVSIVTPKVQTTRCILRAIKVINDTQLVFIDTPGIFKPKSKLEKAILNSAWEGIASGEMLLVILDANKEFTENVQNIFDYLQKNNLKANIIINKIDLIALDKQIELAQKIQELDFVNEVFPISALKNKGVEGLLKFLVDNSKESPWLYDGDQITDAPNRFFASELTREKLFLLLQKELPYNINVVTESWKENNESITIHQTIYVMKDSQKGIILGKKNGIIKKVGQKSREELQEIFEKKVNLFLFVKVRKDWMDKENLYLNYGQDNG